MWIDGNGPLENSGHYSITGDKLAIANVSTISVEEDKAIRCSEVLNNGIIVTGKVYMLEPLGMSCVLRCVLHRKCKGVPISSGHLCVIFQHLLSHIGFHLVICEVDR